LYSLPYIIRTIKSNRTRWTGHVAHIKVIMNLYKILVGKPERKRLLGRARHRWEDNIGVYRR